MTKSPRPRSQKPARSFGALRDPRHEKFAQGLAELKTKEDAYKAAGYVPDGGNAARLAKQPDIQARVAELVEEGARLADVRRSRVIVDIDNVARATVSDFYEWVGTGKDRRLQLRDITTLPRHLAQAIQSVTTHPKTGKVELRLKDGLAASTTLLKHLGGLPEAPISLNVSVFDALSADDQRALADALEAHTRAADATGEPAADERGAD